MVEVPRQIWLDGGRGYALQKLYWRLEHAACERQDAEEALRDVLDECMSMLKSLNASHPLFSKAQLVIQEFPESLRSRRVGTPTPETLSRFRDSEAANIPSEANLVRLRRRAIQVCGRFHRAEAEWMHLIEEGVRAEDREKVDSVSPAVQGFHDNFLKEFTIQ